LRRVRDAARSSPSVPHVGRATRRPPARIGRRDLRVECLGSGLRWRQIMSPFWCTSLSLFIALLPAYDALINNSRRAQVASQPQSSFTWSLYQSDGMGVEADSLYPFPRRSPRVTSPFSLTFSFVRPPIFLAGSDSCHIFSDPHLHQIKVISGF